MVATRQGDQLIDVQNLNTLGTTTVYLEPRFKGGLDGIPSGSSCIANAYSNHHNELESADTGTVRRIFLHAVDTVALVHSMILRIQAHAVTAVRPAWERSVYPSEPIGK